MANSPEADQFDAGVYQLEKTDPVLGGLGGASNAPLVNLANRTRYLYNRIAEILGISKIYSLAGGTANAITGAYTPAVTTVTDGQVLRFKGGFANTGATTFTPNSGGSGAIAAAPIYGRDHQPLTGGEIVVNGACSVQWNAALNSGNGAWVLVENSGGAFRSVANTNAASVVTLAQAQAMQGNYSQFVPVAATPFNATVAQITGGAFKVASNGVVNLPAASTVPQATATKFWNLGSSAFTLAAATGGSDFFTTYAGSQTAIVLQPGDDLEIAFRGNNEINVVGGSAMRQFSELIIAGINSKGRVYGVNSPNLQYNGSGEFGAAGWTLNAGFAAQNDTAGGIGTYFANPAALVTASFQNFGPPVYVGPGRVVTGSFDWANGATAGVIRAQLTAYDSTNTYISDFAALALPNGTANQRLTLTGTTPANTAYVRWNVYVSSPLSAPAFSMVWKRVKVEIGGLATLYSQEASVIGTLYGLQQFTANGSFTVPQGIYTIWVSGCAAGGGGGSTLATNSSSFLTGGSGGGAGQWVIRKAVSVTPGQVIPVTIGSAGVGGTATSNNATAGGATQLGASGALVNLAGGGPGGVGTGGTAVPGNYGGPPGGTGFPAGDWASDTCVYSGGVASGGYGGRGGSTPFGIAGAAGRGASGSCPPSLPGNGYGAGGSGSGGAYNSAVTAAGAAGQAGLPGLLIIEW